MTADPLAALGQPGDLAVGLRPSLLMRRLRDERGEFFAPDPLQEELLDAEDPAIACVALRGGGKSTGVAVKLLHSVLFTPGASTSCSRPLIARANCS